MCLGRLLILIKYVKIGVYLYILLIESVRFEEGFYK